MRETETPKVADAQSRPDSCETTGRHLLSRLQHSFDLSKGVFRGLSCKHFIAGGIASIVTSTVLLYYWMNASNDYSTPYVSETGLRCALSGSSKSNHGGAGTTSTADTPSTKDSPREVRNGLPENVKEYLAKVFEERKILSDRLASSVEETLYLLLISTAFALIACLRPKRRYKIPLLDREVDAILVLTTLPLCIGYFWMKFGFRLNVAVESRAACNRIAILLENDSFANSAPLDDRVVRTGCIRPALQDNGFVDAWFLCFRPDEAPPHLVDLWQVKLIMAGHGILLGLAQSLLLVTAATALAQARGTAARPLGALYYWACLLLMLGSGLNFTIYCMHPNWMVPVSILTMALGTPIIMLARRSAQFRLSDSGAVPQ